MGIRTSMGQDIEAGCWVYVPFLLRRAKCGVSLRESRRLSDGLASGGPKRNFECLLPIKPRNCSGGACGALY